MKNIISMVATSPTSALKGTKLLCDGNMKSLIILLALIGLFYKALDKGYAINASVLFVNGEKVEVNFSPHK